MRTEGCQHGELGIPVVACVVEVNMFCMLNGKIENAPLFMQEKEKAISGEVKGVATATSTEAETAPGEPAAAEAAVGDVVEEVCVGKST